MQEPIDLNVRRKRGPMTPAERERRLIQAYHLALAGLGLMATKATGPLAEEARWHMRAAMEVCGDAVLEALS